MIFDQKTLNNFEQRYRAHFINSLSGFKSANLIGTINQQKQTNLAIVSSVVHLGANPALVGMIHRPHTVTRDTLENIIETKQYTINHVSTDIIKQAHQTSARYPKEISEFDAVGLTEEYTNTLAAPYVKQSNLKIGLKLREIINIELNQTKMIIGEIIEVITDPQYITQDGYIDIESLNTACVSGLDNYHTTKQIERLPYAKPK